MVDWLWYLLLLLASVVGLLVTILGLPGLWLMMASFACYAWLTGWDHYVGWASMGTLLGLGIVAEVMELVAGAAGSKAAGGRYRGMIGAVVGAFFGGILFSFIPVPVVSTIAGACFGAFLGAAILELSDRDFRHALRVGWGAAKGRFWGIIIKLSIGMLMLLIIMAAAII
ncbi:MAG TPA: DUF456 domain-containing protein [Tepidisphaeraceae bacterium]|nr:DUF456 domain-containing protein [Tepidisphaeraceae bacterium]